MTSPITILAAGDVHNQLEDPDAAFRLLSPLLREADIVFGNCEGVYTDNPDLAPNYKAFHGAPRTAAAGLGRAPFHVMSLANNHQMDAGGRGLADTMATLAAQDIRLTGAGQTLAEATTPAILERKGVRVAFLGFCSVFPVGHEARANRPGLAPLRVITTYTTPDPNFWDPANDPLVITTPFADDLAVFQKAIRSARQSADMVIVACHWGHSPQIRDAMFTALNSLGKRQWRNTVAGYERDLARVAIDEGADAVICHHQLNLRGIDFYNGKPIFHGMGILVNHFPEEHLHRLLGSDFSYPYLPFTPDCRYSGLAQLTVDQGSLVSASFIPALILPDGSTEPLRAGDPRVAAQLDHLRGLNIEAGFKTEVAESAWREWAAFSLTPGSCGR